MDKLLWFPFNLSVSMLRNAWSILSLFCHVPLCHLQTVLQYFLRVDRLKMKENEKHLQKTR